MFHGDDMLPAQEGMLTWGAQDRASALMALFHQVARAGCLLLEDSLASPGLM